MKTIFVAMAAIAGVTAVPALAQPEAATAASSAATGAATSAAAKPTKYCISDTPTGSRIPVKECKTRQEWAKDGVDIDRPNG